MSEVSELLSHLSGIYLMMDDGRCLSLEGKAIVISGSCLLYTSRCV